MRSEKEIKMMISAMKNDINGTPDTNAFGDSNAEDIAEIKSMIAELEMALAGISIDEDTEVGSWLAGKSTMIDLYLE